MGLFSKKKKVSVGVTAARLIKKVENPYKQMVITSVFSQKSISQVVLNESAKGLFSKAEQFYNFGKNRYIHGLPEGFKNYSDINLVNISTVLSKIFAQAVTVEFAKVSFADDKYFAYRYLQDEIKFNPTDNTIGVPPVVYPPKTKVTCLSVVLNETNRTATVSAEVQKPAVLPTDPLPPKEYPVWVITYPIDKDKTYLQIKYKLNTDILSLDYRYWYYDVMTNTYPEINTIIDQSLGSPFYPLVPLRQNKINVVDGTGQETKDVKTILGKLSLDPKVLTDALMSTDEGNDPNLVDEAFVGFFAYLDTEQKASKIYLWEFFNDLYQNRQVTKSIFDTWNGNKGSRDTPQEALIITERDFNIRLLWNYINITVSNNIIGSIDTVNISWDVQSRFTLQDFDFETSQLTITRQITATTVSTIVVHGLEHIVDVYEGELHSTTLADMSDPDKKYGMYFPINRNVLKQLNPIDRNIVLTDGISVIVYAVQITYVKWYQRGFFKVLVAIVAIVIAYYTGDWQLAFEAGLTWQTAVSAITSIIINFATIKGLEFVISAIGGEIGAIISAVLAIYALSQGKDTLFSGSIAAPDLLKTSVLALEASNNIVLDELSDITRDLEDLIKSIKEKKEELKEAYDLLRSESIDYFDIRKGGFYFNPNEVPDDFFNRTVHNKNPGTSGYDYISYFVDNALKLEPSSKWEI